MLKKIGLSILFAITFAVGVGAANAKPMGPHAPHAPVPQGLCGKGMFGC